MVDDGSDEVGGVPGMDEWPVRWDARSRSFVPVADATAVAPQPSGPAPAPAATPARKHVVIGPEHVGQGPPGTAPAPARPTARSAASPMARIAGTVAAASAPAAAPPRPAGAAPIVTRRGPRSAEARATAPGQAPPGQPPPPTSPGRGGRGGRGGGRAGGWTRRRVLRVVLAAFVALALLVVGLFGFGWWQFSRIEKVPVAAALSTGATGGTNYLIVGSDSRAGIDESDPNAGAFLGDTTEGQRTDTIMVLRVAGSGSSLLSIPRDLWVTNPVTGEAGRINSVYQSGPAALIQAVRSVGIPVNHYLEIDFVSFGKLVDALGGIDIDFPAPARDTHSGLDVPTAGKAHLDGEQALAFVRSRYYEQYIDGDWQVDGTADLGRVLRQRAFLQALMSQATGTRNPLTLLRVSSSLGGGIKIDDAMSYFDALGLMVKLRGGFTPESATLPVTPRTTSGGAQVLDLNTAEAAPVIAQFGG